MEIKNLFFALRPNQWIKNIFIILPLIFGKKLFSFPSSLKILIACLLFSIVSSVVYIINDIIDLDEDRLHPTKRFRPIASGKVSFRQAKLMACILGIASLALSLFFNFYFGLLTLSYLILNLFYSIILKNVVIIDVFCISAFFLLRIIAGGIIAEVTLSKWIIIITFFLSMFLGLNKRRQELKLLGKNDSLHRQVSIKYSPYFIDQMIAVFTASIVVTYMLYAVDTGTVALFRSKNLVYSIPFVYYGIFRYLYLIHKCEADGDPTRILLSDIMMQINIVLWISVCIAVIYFGL